VARAGRTGNQQQCGENGYIQTKGKGQKDRQMPTSSNKKAWAEGVGVKGKKKAGEGGWVLKGEVTTSRIVTGTYGSLPRVAWRAAISSQRNFFVPP